MTFGPFLDDAEYASHGMFRFTVGGEAVRDAVASLRLAVGAAKEAGLVRLALAGGRLKLSAYANGSFAEEILPATVAHDAPVPAPGVELLLEMTTLAKMSAAFTKGELDLGADVSRLLLRVSQGTARVDLPLHGPALVADHRAKLGLPTLVGAVPTEHLRPAVRYASLFSTDTDAAIANVAAVDFAQTVRGEAGRVTHNGLVVGGSDRTLLAMLSGSLLGLNMGIPGPQTDFVHKALGRLDPGKAQLYRTDTFFVLLDGRRMFGWTRPTKPFPAVQAEKHLRGAPSDFVRAPRAAVRQALARAGTVVERAGMVQLTLRGTGENAQLIVRMTHGGSGRLAEDTVPITRAQANGIMHGRDREVMVQVDVLSTLLGHFADDFVSIAFDGPVLRIFDKLPDASAVSVIACETADASAAKAA